jgi:recombination protein RecT
MADKPETTAVAKKTEAPKTLAQYLDQNKEMIMAVAPKHMTPEKMIGIAVNATRRTPALKECMPLSILGCIITAAQLGLEMDDVRGHGYMVPFNNKNTGNKEAQFMIGYKGLVKLALNHPDVHAVRAYTVFKADYFDYELGLRPTLSHKPYDGADDKRGGATHYYAVIDMKVGDPLFYVMTIHEVMAHAKRFSKATSGPWKTDFDEMAKKTVIKKALKLAPESPNLSKALALDESASVDVPQKMGSDFGISTGAEEATRSNLESLKEKIEDHKAGAGESEAEFEEAPTTDYPKDEMRDEPEKAESDDKAETEADTKPDAKSEEKSEPEAEKAATMGEAKDILTEYLRGAKEEGLIKDSEYIEACEEASKPDNKNLEYMDAQLKGWKDIVAERQGAQQGDLGL